MKQAVNVEAKGKPQRNRLDLPVSLHKGDVVDFIVHARDNHDCDGVFLIDVQVIIVCVHVV